MQQNADSGIGMLLEEALSILKFLVTRFSKYLGNWFVMKVSYFINILYSFSLSIYRG